MGMVDKIVIEKNIEINEVVLEKGEYQTKDLYVFDPSEGFFAYFTTDYKVLSETKELQLQVDDFVLSKVPKKYHKRLELKPNGIVNIYDFKTDNNGDYTYFKDYRLVLEDGIIKELYRADSEKEIEKYPKHIQKNYNAEWK